MKAADLVYGTGQKSRGVKKKKKEKKKKKRKRKMKMSPIIISNVVYLVQDKTGQIISSPCM